MAARVPTIASGAIRKILAEVEAAGVDPKPLLAKVGLAPATLEDQDGRVPLGVLHSIWEEASTVIHGPGCALRVAQRYSPGDYGLFGFVAMNSATLEEAVRQTARFKGLWTDDPAIELHGVGVLRVVYRTPLTDRVGLRLATETALAQLLNGARLLTQRHVAPIAVRFAHPGPADTSAHDAFFGCPVHFHANDTALVLRPEDLELPLPKADAQLAAYLRSIADSALQKRGLGETSELDRVRAVIAEELQTGVPSLDEVARRMATGERTLRRRLESEGTSFRNLVDETRGRLAKSYVGDRRLPLSEVAFLLGFSEPSAFHRAFKRWTGTTPSAFRERPESVTVASRQTRRR